ncbi:glycoside hydrolase family 108 protein [Derxia gummosa]|uniref:Glycoside hydrolase family 108 protein n=1 Tax=Derxia gummosa DSM 723 TaxID=1121388 RepID=A0A8B6X4S5_9BURK|nr:glycosyl hydrolase 108 family protein [Derxia gummosa]
MADFDKALALTLKAEGGYSKDPDDPGGETWKGIARNRQPRWPGWALIDAAKNQASFPANLDQNADLQELVRTFYRNEFWNRIHGDDIAQQEVAEAIFDFGVNAGAALSVRLAQAAVQAEVDGAVGGDTLARLNAVEPHAFLALFTVAKIARYVSLCEQNAGNRKYFYGWVRRALAGV